jgi:predicted transcriptional regulator
MVDKSKPSAFPSQLNIRLDEETRKALSVEADLVKSSPSQIAREAITKEISRRRMGREVTNL